jgi:tetratricopeptide (TPR) repeat protein
MFTIRNLKLWLYNQLVRFPLGVLLLFLFVTAALVSIIGQKGVPLRSGSDLWANIVIFALAVNWLVLFLTGIFIWAWYFVWFRYLAYGAACIISLFRRLFKNTFFQFIIILVISAGFWEWRKRLFLGRDYNPEKMLIFSQAIKILVIAVLVLTVWQIFKSRKRISISNFENYTGDKQLEQAVKGVAAMILNEANRLSKLVKTIDDIQPESKQNVIEPKVDVEEMGKDLGTIIGQESSVCIGKVIIPLRPVYALFNKLVHGPILSGGVHLKGEKLVVIACLKGGKFSGSWEISIDDIENPPTSRSEQLIAITDQLVCRIIAYISQGGSPRWKAMNHYTRALGLYRETLLKRENKKLNLIKAKNEFNLALTDDSEFVQCYYNLGVIYNKLDSNEVARGAFRKVLESAPDNYHCYYELARLYYYKENYFDALWFCDQALTICPTDADNWNLWAVIKFKEVYKLVEDDYKKKVDIPDDVVEYFMNASVLAWRALCESIINGEKIPQFKETARICIRNLAKIRGMRKQWRSRCLFKQAIFLAPDNNDLLFESGKYYYRYYSHYRKNKIIKAYNAFNRVFEDDKEVDNSFSYWAYYINVKAKLCRKTKNKKKKGEYEEVVKKVFFHFLDAASEIIQNKKKMPKDIEIHEKQISEALFLKMENEKDKGFLLELIDILDGFKPITSKGDREIADSLIKEYLQKWTDNFSRYCPKLPGYFKTWVEVQEYIKLAILTIKEINKGSNQESNNQKERKDSIEEVIKKFISLIRELEQEHLNGLKIMGLKRYLAEAYFILKNYNEALKSAMEAARLAPYNWEIRELLGRIYFALNDYQKAVNEFEISARLEEHSPDVLIEILKKSGKAYEENGNILRDPEQRKNSFNKAVEFFNDSLEILGDKSYENKDKEEDDQYIQCLAEIHFYLGTFHRELLNYDNAITHFRIAREMGYEISATLVKIGWTYFECGDFNEAEPAFEEAKSTPGGSSAEIRLGIELSKVERTLPIRSDDLSEDKEPLKILKDVKKLLNKIEEPREKTRLSALYHECLGRLHLKQEKPEEAKKEFEKSLSYRANPRTYYYLAELYWKRAGESEEPLRNLYLAQTRSAFSLCLRNDFQQKYKDEVSELLDKLSAFEKPQKNQKLKE